jgi:hypothetical protein
MSVITVARGDLTCEQVAEALRRAFGPAYHVLPGAAFDHSPRDGLSAGDLDTIVVGTGSDRFFRAQVTIARRSDTTRLHVIPGGLPGTWPGGLRLINRLRIARRVHHALEAALDLRGRS